MTTTPDQDLWAELRTLLRESSRARRALEKSLADPSAPVALVLEQARSLAALAKREQRLVRELERALGDRAPASGARSLRERALDLLGETGVAARAGLLAAHLELRDGAPADVRRFGALRRYEAQSWRENPGGRAAYIAPALDASGRVYGAWMTRSDWTLERRVIVSAEHASMLEIQELLLLVRGAESPDSTGATGVKSLFAYHAQRLLDVIPPDSLPDEVRWRDEVEAKGDLAVRFLRARVDGCIAEVASKLATSLRPEEQLWGRQRN